jgi:hypothetical protein
VHIKGVDPCDLFFVTFLPLLSLKVLRIFGSMDILLEVEERRIRVRRGGGEENMYRVRNKYVEIRTSTEMMRRDMVFGRASDGQIYLIRLAAGREEAVAEGQSGFTVNGERAIFLAAGLKVFEASSGMRFELIPSSEIIDENEAKILSSGDMVILIDGVLIHSYHLRENTHFRMRMKIKMKKDLASISDEQIVGISCEKGDVYLLDAEKMRLVKSMRNFGSAITSLAFWPGGQGLLLATARSEVISVDFKENKAVRKVHVEYPDARILSTYEDKAVLVSGDRILFLSCGTGEIVQRWTLSSQTFLVVFSTFKEHPEESSRRAFAVSEKSSAEESVVDENVCNRTGEEKASETNLSADRTLELIHSFEQLKDQVHSMADQLFREMFVMKKRVEQIEKHLYKR